MSARFAFLDLSCRQTYPPYSFIRSIVCLKLSIQRISYLSLIVSGLLLVFQICQKIRISHFGYSFNLVIKYEVQTGVPSNVADLIGHIAYRLHSGRIKEYGTSLSSCLHIPQGRQSGKMASVGRKEETMPTKHSSYIHLICIGFTRPRAS